ncbi:MAG TPA: hypothetical protein VK574_04340 [Terracidiphilus sp.]|nr:hypothetical protein [Terracidiphilus sp.]
MLAAEDRNVDPWMPKLKTKGQISSGHDEPCGTFRRTVHAKLRRRPSANVDDEHLEGTASRRSVQSAPTIIADATWAFSSNRLRVEITRLPAAKTIASGGPDETFIVICRGLS